MPHLSRNMDDQINSRRVWTTIVALLLLGSPGALLRFSGMHVDPIVAAAVYGVSIVAGAFLLSWAAEVAEMDVSASLAHCGAGPDRSSPGIRHRNSVGVGRRIILRHWDQSGYE